MIRSLTSSIVLALMLASPVAVAQQPAGEPPEEGSPATQDDRSGAEHYARAVEAREAGNLEAALRELELAYRVDSNPRYVHTRILVLEELGHATYALRLLRSHRAALEKLDATPTVWKLEERLRQAVQRDGAAETSESDLHSDTDTDPDAQAATTDKAERSDPDILGLLTLGSGLVLVGAGTGLWVGGLRIDARLRCTPASGLPSSGCEDDGFGDISVDTYDRRRARSRTFVTVGIAAIATGVAAAGFGMYRLFSARPADSETTASLGVTPGGVQLLIRF